MDTDQQQNNDDPVVEGIDKAVDEFLKRSDLEREEIAKKTDGIMARADATAAKLEADNIDGFFEEEEVKLAEEGEDLLLKYLEEQGKDD